MTEDEGYIVLATILVPLIGSLVTTLVPSQFPNVVRGWVTLLSTIMLALSIYIFVAYQVGDEDFQMTLHWAWIENVAMLGDNGVSLHLGIDGIAAPMVLLTGIVIFSGTLVSWKIDYRNKDYFVLLLALVAGVYGTFVALDLFFFFFFYELAVLPMYLLIAVWGSTRKEYGAMKLTLMLVAASILIFTGIFATFSEAGTGSFDLPTLWAAEYDRTFQLTFFPLMVIGCGVLAGLWPFHTWSPDGHVAAPTAVSMLHAGVLMKLGAFGIIRLGIQMFPEGAEFWMPGLLVLGTINAVYGAISALSQKDLKFVIGYSSVSHMGYVLMGLATLNSIGMTGAVLQMFSHGVMTALFFTLVGVIYDQAHTREIAVFGGIAKIMPVFTAFWVLASMASLGLPGLSGFVAEFNIFVGTFHDYPLFGAFGILAAAITATYLLRLLAVAFFGPLNEKWAALKDMRPFEFVAAGLLALSIIAMGIWPKPFTDRIENTILDIPGVEQIS
jgi:NADH-quinone oxidoreductase subunit M